MVTKKAFEGIESLFLSNGSAELVVSISVGPRILSYRLKDGENILGLWLAAEQPNDLGTWKPYGGHRLWAAPESMPRTYYPDNDPVEYEIIDEDSVLVRAPIERVTNLQKEMRITLGNENEVTIQHLLANKGTVPAEIAPWALTILRGGGTAIVPQEPFRSHDDYLLPARPMVLWHFTNLADPRFRISQELLEMQCEAKFESTQKVGVLNKQGWAAYSYGALLFIKEFDYRQGANYPDYGANCETYSQGNYLELETLGPIELLQPGESAAHRERWRLIENVTLPEAAQDRAEAISKFVQTSK